MDKKIVLDALKRYFNTIQNIGYINSKEYGYLIIMMFLVELIDNGMTIGLTKDDIVAINKLIKCFRNTGRCVTKDLEYIDNLGWDNFYLDVDNILTNDSIVIATGAGAEMVTNARETMKFMDFNPQYTFDPNDFVVGYDDETNSETRVNVGTIASIWS